jgi:hypothetical protein
MTAMSKLRSVAFAVLAGLFVLSGNAAMAGDHSRSRLVVKHSDRSVHLDGRNADSRWDRGHHRRGDRRNTLVRVSIDRGHWNGRRQHQTDTYSGDVDIYSRRNVGEWSYGALPSTVSMSVQVPNAKIIDDGAMKPNAACAMEAGVCVIRP